MFLKKTTSFSSRFDRSSIIEQYILDCISFFYNVEKRKSIFRLMSAVIMNNEIKLEYINE